MKKVNSSGFTLIEILVAIAILSFISIGVFQILDNTIDTQSSVTKEDKEFVQTQTGLRRLESDFERIYTPLYFDFPKVEETKEKERFAYNPEEQNPYNNHDNFDGVTSLGLPIPAIFYEKQKEIIFFTRTNTRKFQDSKVTSFQWVRYRMESSVEREGLSQLTRQSINKDIYSNNLSWQNSPIYTVVDGIKKFEFFLWDIEKKDWTDSIPERGKYYGPLLKIKLIWIDQKENQNLVQKVFRIYFPNFDTLKDEELKRRAMYPSLNKTSPAQPGARR